MKKLKYKDKEYDVEDTDEVFVVLISNLIEKLECLRRVWRQ